MKTKYLIASIAWACLGCAREASTTSSSAQVTVMQTLKFAREQPQGVASGFNLDGRVSDWRDRESCGKQDFVDAEGRPGIDNQLATLLPALDTLGQGAIEGLVQDAVNDGRLLVVMKMTRLSADKAKIELERGNDTPLLGTDGHILPGQTLALDASPLLGLVDNAVVKGDAVSAGPFALKFPVVILNNLYVLELSGAMLRFRLTEGGGIEDGLIGGGASVEQIHGFLRTAGGQAGADLLGTFGPLVNETADLDFDPRSGECKGVSVAVTFNAVQAFTF